MIRVPQVMTTDHSTSPDFVLSTPQRRRPCLRAAKFIRPLRGPSRSALGLANDGWHYAIKRPNPDTGSRTLINEWLGSRLLRLLGIRTAGVEPIEIPGNVYSEFRRRDDRNWNSEANGEDVIGAAIAYPASPERQAIYDFLPAPLAPRVPNLDQLVGTLVFDAWAGQTKKRQAVFHREGHGWVATVIDHAGLFGGSDWEIPAARVKLPSRDRLLLVGLCSEPSFDPWIKKLAELESELIRAVFAEIPEYWLSVGQRTLLHRLAENLIQRRTELDRIIV
jgi:hypothetical protein